MNKKEKLFYALGGVGHNLVYAMFSGFLLIFYTDVFGLSPAFTGILFLLARIFDTVNDPMMGYIADRTRSRFGRYRVWLFRAAPLVAAALCLCFFVPDVSKTLQYIYCYFSYFFLAAAFTCADIPYWTLPSVMTEDAQERNRVFGIGSFAGCLASGIGAVAVPIVVESAGDFGKGYLICAIIFSAIGAICYIACGAAVKERVAPAPQKVDAGAAVTALIHNKPLCIAIAASLFGNLAFQIKVAFNTYYGQYALGDFGYITLLSAMLLVGMLIGSAVIPAITNRFGGKAAMMGTLIAGMVINLAYYLCGYQSLAVVLVFSALCAVVVGSFSVLVSSMTADAIDYAELQQGQRNEGVITSTRTFVTNLATAFAGSAAAFLLEVIGYIPNVEQSVHVKDALHTFMSLCPVVLYGIAAVILIFYPLTKKKFGEIQEALASRRSAV